SFANACLNQQAVNDCFNRVISSFVETNLFVERQQLAVDTRAQKTFLREFLQFFLKLTFATTNNRRERHHAFAFRQREHVLNNLIDTLPRDRSTANMTMRNADRREQQTHVIVDLRHCSDGGTWTTRNGLLFDGNRGREAV